MGFQEKLKTGSFVVTTEVGPPRGISLEKTLQEIAPLKGRVDAVNVTDLQSSCLRMSALAAALFVRDKGFEPILQMTCRDRNRLALQADLLASAALGLNNILVLTGDHPVLGDHPEAKPVFDLDAVQLMETVRLLNAGEDLGGHKLVGQAPRLFPGAVVNPGADPLEPEIIKMEKKAQAGARFFQTQAIFDVGLFEKFLAAVKHLRVPVLAGIVLLKSEKMALHLNAHVPGIHVPDRLVAQVRDARDKKATAVDISARLIRDLKGMAAGVHLMPIGWHSVLPCLLDNINS